MAALLSAAGLLLSLLARYFRIMPAAVATVLFVSAIPVVLLAMFPTSLTNTTISLTLVAIQAMCSVHAYLTSLLWAEVLHWEDNDRILLRMTTLLVYAFITVVCSTLQTVYAVMLLRRVAGPRDGVDVAWIIFKSFVVVGGIGLSFVQGVEQQRGAVSPWRFILPSLFLVLESLFIRGLCARVEVHLTEQGDSMARAAVLSSIMGGKSPAAVVRMGKQLLRGVSADRLPYAVLDPRHTGRYDVSHPCQPGQIDAFISHRCSAARPWLVARLS